MNTIQTITIWAIPVLFAITLHEVAHGWVANKLGDPTAKILGRLTLNPIKHMDPIGTVVLPMIMVFLNFLPFGWAKPVPVDWRNLNHPKRDMAWVAVAGPASNLIMLIIWVLLLILLNNSVSVPTSVFVVFSAMAVVGIKINILLILLNMIPFPPLDGSRIMASFLSPAMSLIYHRIERWGLLIMLALIITLSKFGAFESIDMLLRSFLKLVLSI